MFPLYPIFVQNLGLHKDGTDFMALLCKAGSTGNVDYLRYAERLGAAATLKKPVSPQELLDVLSRLLGSN